MVAQDQDHNVSDGFWRRVLEKVALTDDACSGQKSGTEYIVVGTFCSNDSLLEVQSAKTN